LIALDEILPGGFDRMKLEALVSGVMITAHARAMIEERKERGGVGEGVSGGEDSEPKTGM
jgi:hypothetical protein